MTVVEQEHVASQADSRPPRLKASGVSKSFGPVKALADVNFEVAAGEIHGLIGENGAGKSTLMAVASGALVPDEGLVAIDGERTEGDPERARSLGLAIVRQHPALLSELTVADNLLFGLPAAQRAEIKNPVSWARECLALWGDRPDIDPKARVLMLNPEQQFVVEVTRALYQQPGVLVLDEPSEHLGAEGVEYLFSVMRRLAEEGIAIVYISHRIREIREISDRVTVLRDGVIRGTRETSELSPEEIVNLIIGRSLSAAYPDKPTPRAFDDGPTNALVEDFSGEKFSDINLEIKAGEIVGLAGIDGNGQEEIARALAGLESSKGEVTLSGEPVSVRSARSAARSGIAYIPADRKKEGIFAELSVRANTSLRAIGSLCRGPLISSAKEREKTDEMLGKFAVKTSSPEAPISSLSGGNQQKVVMAGALLDSPKLVIADQPTQGVDVGSKADIYYHLREMAVLGSSVLVLSSDNTELAGLCDRVLVVSRGQIVASLDGDGLEEKDITDAVLRAESRREHKKKEPSKWARIADSDMAPLPVLGAIILVFALITQSINENYLSVHNIGTVLSLAAVLAMVSLGQGLVMLRRGIDLSVGPVMSLTVVIASFYIIDGAGLVYHAIGWMLLLGLCVVVGTVNWALVDRLKVHPVLATFGTWMLIESIALLLRPTPSGLIAGNVVTHLNTRYGFLPVAVLIVLVLAVLLEYWRTRTNNGRRLLAAGNNAPVASSLGISESRTALAAYIGCSLLAGLAGVLLIARVGSGDPTAGNLYTLQAVAAVVVGGMSVFGARGSFIGVILAALLLTQVRTSTTFLGLSDAWQNIFLAVVTIGAVFVYSIVRRITRGSGGAS